MSSQVSQENQGKLQGMLVSLTNATGVIGPLMFSIIFGQTLGIWDGWVWMIGTLLYLALISCFLLFYRPQHILKGHSGISDVKCY